MIPMFLLKQIVEMGASRGGYINYHLIAIKDMKNAHLFSIDISKEKYIGEEVKYNFSELLNK